MRVPHMCQACFTHPVPRLPPLCAGHSLLDSGVLTVLAWSVHLPGPRCHIKQPLLTELTWKHKCWCTSDGFAFLLFLIGPEVRKPGNSAEL